MSVHVIEYKNGAKTMRPIQNFKEFAALRNSKHNREMTQQARNGNADGKRSEIPFEADFTNMYQKEVAAFSKAVLEETPVPVSMEDGLWIQKVAEAAYQAQAESRVVEVE